MTISARAAPAAPWVTLFGNVTLLIGLGWDAILHRLDPTLAEREGISTLSNPGHVLFGLGIALVTLGVGLFLIGRMAGTEGMSRGRRAAMIVPVAVLIALSGISFAVAMTSESNLGSHSHDQEHAETTADLPSATLTSEHVLEDDHEHDAEDSHGDGHDHADSGPMATPTDAEQAAADQLLTETEAGAARFAAIAVAEADGFVQVTPYPFGDAGPAHFVNPIYNNDSAILDPERPESLIYYRFPDGRTILLGVMFLAPAGESVAPGGPLTPWHDHPGMCLDPSAGGVPANADGSCPAGSFAVEAEMMHVWLFDHPDGRIGTELSLEALTVAAQDLT
ncbi:MAG: hypothetical protein ACRDJH_24570 [Thermomicrobiales bacterium]